MADGSFAAGTLAACTELSPAGIDDPVPAEAPSRAGMILRFGPRAIVDSLFPVAVLPPGAPPDAGIGVPQPVRAWDGYFLCPTRAGLVRRELETVTRDGSTWLTVWPVGSIT